MDKEAIYQHVSKNIEALLAEESDSISTMSTIACELFHAFAHWNWVGFYRLVDSHTLKVGPYQGTHGCLTIAIDRGVCGRCVRENALQLENDVRALPYHIACSVDTRAEIVLPVHDQTGALIAVLDIDAVEKNCFDAVDVQYLQAIVASMATRV